MEHLYEKLIQYGQGGDYPLHMPGHKRRLYGYLSPKLFEMDITEIDGFDNLHAPEGILAELKEWIARFYGARESYVLVGSSTAGILSAVSTVVPFGGHILMARNCHKSAYHAAYLRQLQVSYLFPHVMEGYGIADGITPQQVDEALNLEKDIDAVLIVSPTYEGRISDISKIANVVHAHGKMLIVDAAHGAHLVLSEPWGLQGADLVVHSIHKTLPALTQTALLHVGSDKVDQELLNRFLRIYQSSSPSYVLMAGVDNCMTILERDGKELYRQLAARFRELTEDLKNCKNIRILATNCEEGERFDPRHQDIGKLLLFPAPSKMTGQQLYDLLREKYHLQLEMAAESFCLAMFTIGDTEEGFARLREAIREIDDGMTGQGKALGRMPRDDMQAPRPQPRKALPLHEAWDAPWEEIPLEDCDGRIAAEFINLYPPGTPILVPGERFTAQVCESLAAWHAQGLNLQGVTVGEHSRGERSNGEHSEGEHFMGEHSVGEHSRGECSRGEHSDGKYSGGESIRVKVCMKNEDQGE